MKKNELVAALAEKLGTSKTESGRVLEAVFDTIAAGLTSHGEVKVKGFGAFRVKHVKEQQRRNPSTGETFLAPPSKKVVFKAAAELSESV